MRICKLLAVSSRLSCFFTTLVSASIWTSSHSQKVYYNFGLNAEKYFFFQLSVCNSLAGSLCIVLFKASAKQGAQPASSSASGSAAPSGGQASNDDQEAKQSDA